MRRWICLLAAAFMIMSFWVGATARLNPEKRAELEARRSPMLGEPAVDDEFFNDIHVGAIWFPAISNKCYVGYDDISGWYPGGSDQSYVWQAGMWAGGYVEDGEGGFYDNAFRYLGSDGVDGDLPPNDDLDVQAVVETESTMEPPLPFPFRRLTVRANTDGKPLQTSEGEIVDGDMGMDVTYQWYQWGVPGYDNWVFIHVTIAFKKSIEDFYWGWMSDCDCGDINEPDPYFDDFAGWDEAHQFCYMRDWDYDPPPQAATEATADSLFLSPGVVAQVLLAAPNIEGPITAEPDSLQKWVSKNYWDWNNDVSSVQNTYDRLAGIWENPFPPEDDFDYRILNGVGPYQVTAGDIGHFWMAYVLGEGYDDEDHQTFGLGNLVTNVEAAQKFYNDGMVIPTTAYVPMAPDLDPDFDQDVSAEGLLTVHWDPYVNVPDPGVEADSFIVYTSEISKIGPWTWLASFDNTTTSTVVQLLPGFYKYVWVQAYSNASETGSNPWALSSRLYEVDSDGILRANDGTIVSPLGNTPAESVLDKISVAPNPYIGSNPAELAEYETVIGFHHLPEKCEIYIYTLLGNLVDIIHHDATSGSEFWDMTTRSGEAISSGLYVYRVKAENGEEALGKFAVIKGQR